MRLEITKCVVCGAEIKQTGRGRARKYCSPEHQRIGSRKPGVRAREESRWEDPIVKASMLQLVNEGLTLREIGDEFGMTRERARQIIERLGLRDHYRLRREQVKAEREARQEAWLQGQIRKRVANFTSHGNGDSVLHAIANDLGVDPHRISEEIRKLGIILPVTAGTTGHPTWTDEELVAILQEVASHYPDNGVNMPRYREHWKPGWPSWQTYESSTRFETLQDACDIAGVEYVRKPNWNRIYDRIPDEDMIAAIREYAEAAFDAGERPTFAGLTQYCRDNGLPSAAAMRKRFIPYTEIFQEIAARRVEEELDRTGE